MKERPENDHNPLFRGIKLTRLNVIMILAGIVITVFLVLSMYQTSDHFGQIVHITSSYLGDQQTAGMLKDIAGGMSEQAEAFLHTSAPENAFAYAGQMDAILEQMRKNQTLTEDGINPETDENMLRAVEAWQAQREMELRAMRLHAETLNLPPQALPPALQTVELTEEETALSPEEKSARAQEILHSEGYRALRTAVNTGVDDNHRLASERGQIRAAKTAGEVQGIIGRQKILVYVFVFIAVLALFLNWFLMLRPIGKSVENLDHREKIPVKGAYEMRRMAQVYNDVLQDNETKEEQLSYTASHDALTGVYNRAAFEKFFEACGNDAIGIAVIDVDHFKNYNDEHGHDIGDRVLDAVARRIITNFREPDHVSRIGGDEFCVIIPGVGQKDAPVIEEKIVRINQELKEREGELPPITISAGIAFWNRPNPMGTLLKDADRALLEIKKTRETHCRVYGESIESIEG